MSEYHGFLSFIEDDSKEITDIVHVWNPLFNEDECSIFVCYKQHGVFEDDVRTIGGLDGFEKRELELLTE